MQLLEHLNFKVAARLTQETEQFENAVTIRNCVVHSAGLVVGDRYESQIRNAVAKVSGFALSKEGFLGESIHIEKGAIEALARHALSWVPALDKECWENGTFAARSS